MMQLFLRINSNLNEHGEVCENYSVRNTRSDLYCWKVCDSYIWPNHMCENTILSAKDKNDDNDSATVHEDVVAVEDEVTCLIAG